MNENIVFLAYIFVIGCCIGSFLNVVALRGLTGESIVLPPSRCPVCKNKLKWWMNIPILSYLFLRGKCHFCKTHVSIQYPIVEFLTGLFFVLIVKYVVTLLPYQVFFYLIAFCILLVMSICDIKESVILDYHAYMLIAVGLIFQYAQFHMFGFIMGLICGVFGYILYEVLARIGYIFAGQRAFGEGDSLIAAGIGVFFGFKMMIVSVVLSVLLMAIFTLPYFFVHSYKTGKKRTCIGLSLSLLLIALCFLVSTFQLLETFLASMIFLAFVISLIFWSAKQILSEMRLKDENGEDTMCMLPFGPAMAVSFVIIMFFQMQLTDIYNSVIDTFM